MRTSIRRFVAANGERTAVLVDGEGMPLFYPNLFVTWRLRSSSLAANSILNALNAVKALFVWQDEVGIDLEVEFSKGELLDEELIRDLSDSLQRALPSQGKKIVSIKRKALVIGASNYFFRLTVVANYLEFLANRLMPSGQSDGAVRLMVGMIKANRPPRPNKSAVDRDERHLDEAVLELIVDFLKPGSRLNPARLYSVQLRNLIMFEILRVTGMRRGELLNLKISDFDFLQGTLTIVRRPDSKEDVRTHQPVVKTRQRVIPLAPELLALVYDYVLHYRNKFPGAKKHGYLFVTHKEGPSQGHPLSISAFQKWMSNISSVIQGSGLHAHALRHHWNYTFSLLMDEQGVKPEREAKARSYLMGWSETSGTAQIYNKRHNKQRAAKAALELQRRHLRNKDEVLDE